jgi:hypothetical protein
MNLQVATGGVKQSHFVCCQIERDIKPCRSAHQSVIMSEGSAASLGRFFQWGQDFSQPRSHANSHPVP